MVFENRKHAGEILATKLLKFKDTDAIVLALPRGGVPVAAEIANELNLPLNVLIVRKIGALFNSELAVGAVCENDEPLLSHRVLSQTGLGPDDYHEVISKEKKKISQQIIDFRGGSELPSLEGRTVIVVDDGLATGATMEAAIRFLRKKNVRRIVVAVPVAVSASAKLLRKKVNEVIVGEEPEDLLAVGYWYGNFDQVTNEEVSTILKSYRKNRPKRSSADASSLKPT